MSRFKPSYNEKFRVLNTYNQLNEQYISPQQELSRSLKLASKGNRASAAFNNLGVKSEINEFVLEAMQDDKGVLLTREFINLFGENTDFENGMTGWVLGGSGDGKTAIESTEQAFIGEKSIKLYGGTLDTDFGVLYRKMTLLPGEEYMVAFAIYYPDVILESPSIYANVNSSYPQFKGPSGGVVPTGKKNWWWAFIKFNAIDGASRPVGIRVQGTKTMYIGAAVLIKTPGTPMRYVEGTKKADKLMYPVDIPSIFTAGLIVKSSQLYTFNGSDVSNIATFKANNGDKYAIQYDKTTYKFMVTKTIGEVTTQVLSDAVAYNPHAVFGIAIQQTATDLKLFVTIPRGIVLKLAHDGHILLV